MPGRPATFMPSNPVTNVSGRKIAATTDSRYIRAVLFLGDTVHEVFLGYQRVFPREIQIFNISCDVVAFVTNGDQILIGHDGRR